MSNENPEKITINDLIGSFGPEWTDGKNSVEWIREQREEKITITCLMCGVEEQLPNENQSTKKDTYPTKQGWTTQEISPYGLTHFCPECSRDYMEDYLND